MAHPGSLSHRGTRTGPHVAAARVVIYETCFASLVSHPGIRAYGDAAEAQVVNATLTDDWHQGDAGIIPDAVLFQAACDAVGCRKAICRPAREHQGIERVVPLGSQGLRLPRSRPSAENFDGSAPGRGEPEDGYARAGSAILGVAYADPLYGGKGNGLRFGYLSVSRQAEYKRGQQ